MYRTVSKLACCIRPKWDTCPLHLSGTWVLVWKFKMWYLTISLKLIFISHMLVFMVTVEVVKSVVLDLSRSFLLGHYSKNKALEGSWRIFFVTKWPANLRTNNLCFSFRTFGVLLYHQCWMAFFRWLFRVSGSVAEWSKALVLGTSLRGGVGCFGWTRCVVT